MKCLQKTFFTLPPLARTNRINFHRTVIILLFDEQTHLFYISPMHEEITRVVLTHFPDVQAIYLFGSHGTEDEWPTSDVDIALLLPPQTAKQIDFWALNDLRSAPENLLSKEVDLINLRQVSTVFQKEIIMTDRRIYCADQYAADEFEMLTLSFYQKLNEERAEILAEGLASDRFYNV